MIEMCFSTRNDPTDFHLSLPRFIPPSFLNCSPVLLTSALDALTSAPLTPSPSPPPPSYALPIRPSVYFIITLSDLECDYINARQCCSKLNKVNLSRTRSVDPCRVRRHFFKKVGQIDRKRSTRLKILYLAPYYSLV